MDTRLHYKGYTAPSRWAPQWTVAYLVFQGGVPMVRNDSLTGGGQIYGHEFQGLPQPLTLNYAPGVQSTVGGGQIPGLPAYLAPLFGGARGQGS